MLTTVRQNILIYHLIIEKITAITAFNPLIAGAVHIRFLHFILAHYISAFKPVKDKK